jgi:hypothetical protein
MLWLTDRERTEMIVTFAEIRRSKKLILYELLMKVVSGNATGSDDLGQDE